MTDLKTCVYLIIELEVGMINSVQGSLNASAMEGPTEDRQDTEREIRGLLGSIYQHACSRKGDYHAICNKKVTEFQSGVKELILALEG